MLIKRTLCIKEIAFRTISWFRALNLQTLDKKEVIHLFLFLFTLQLLPVLHLTLCPKCLWVGSSSSLLLISRLIFFPLDFRYIRLLFVWHFVLIWKCFCILFYVQLDVGALYFQKVKVKIGMFNCSAKLQWTVNNKVGEITKLSLKQGNLILST